MVVAVRGRMPGARRTSVRTEFVTDDAQLLAARNAWRRLYAAEGSQNPFLHWEWVWHWWRDFRRLESRPGSLPLMLLFTDDRGIMRGAAPFFVTTRWSGLAGSRTL